MWQVPAGWCQQEPGHDGLQETGELHIAISTEHPHFRGLHVLHQSLSAFIDHNPAGFGADPWGTMAPICRAKHEPSESQRAATCWRKTLVLTTPHVRSSLCLNCCPFPYSATDSDLKQSNLACLHSRAKSRCTFLYLEVNSCVAQPDLNCSDLTSAPALQQLVHSGPALQWPVMCYSSFPVGYRKTHLCFWGSALEDHLKLGKLQPASSLNVRKANSTS